jgi:hypothetical protein
MQRFFFNVHLSKCRLHYYKVYRSKQKHFFIVLFMRRGILIIFLVISFIAKNGAYTSRDYENAAPVKVRLNYTANTLPEGESFRLVVVAEPEDSAGTKGQWTSSNEKIATIDSDGSVKALKKGTAVMTFTTEDGSKTAKCDVTVNEDAGKKDDEAIPDNDIYILENTLYLKTPLVYDLIYVYTLSGLQIDKFVKDTELFVKDVSSYPSGTLIITNGKDLTCRIRK